MDPVTLTTDRLILRMVGARHTDAVYAAAQDPDIQRWTTVPAPYLREHARSFTQRVVPDGWADGSLLTWGLFLRDTVPADRPEAPPAGVGTGPGEEEGPLVGMLSLIRRSRSVAEVGFWGARERRGNGYVTEATVAAARWAFAELSVDRVEWRAEVGNKPSRAVAERAGFVLEGVLRSAIVHQGVRRDCWVGSLLPSDLDLPSTAPYLPASARAS